MTITIGQTINNTDTDLTIGDTNNTLIFNANKIFIYEVLDPEDPEDPGIYYELIKSDTGTVIEKKVYNLTPTTTTNNNITITNNGIYTAEDKYLQIGNDSHDLTINNFVLYLKDNNEENPDLYKVDEFVESIATFDPTNLSPTDSITTGLITDTITATGPEKKWYIGSDSDTNNIYVILKGSIINFNSFDASSIPIYSSGGDGGDEGEPPLDPPPGTP